MNRRGEPIVCTPDDALEMFKGSGLKHLAIGDFLINKKGNAQNFGKGHALKKAFKYANGDPIVWCDVNPDLHSYQIKTFHDIMVLNDADIVIGSKIYLNSKVNYLLTIAIWYRMYI